MPAVELSNGDSAILYSRNEISERTNRTIGRAFMVAGATAMKLQNLGFDETDMATWDKWSLLPEEDQDMINAYQAALIVGMIKSWSRGELPTMESALDLPTALFQELALLCSNEYSNTPEFSPDGVTDPKVPTDN